MEHQRHDDEETFTGVSHGEEAGEQDTQSQQSEASSVLIERERSSPEEQREDLSFIEDIISRQDAKLFSHQTLKKAIQTETPLMVEILLRHNAYPINEELVVIAATRRRPEPKILEMLLDCTTSLVIDDRLLVEVFKRGSYGFNFIPLLQILLQHKRPHTVTNEEVIKAAVAMRGVEDSTIRLIFQHWDQPHVSDDTLMIAIGNDSAGKTACTTLLEYRNEPVTEVILEKALRSSSPNAIVQALVAHGVEVSLAQDFMDRVCVEYAGNRKLLELLTELKQDKASVLRILPPDELAIDDPDTMHVSNAPVSRSCPCQVIRYDIMSAPYHDSAHQNRSGSTYVYWGWICVCAQDGCEFCALILKGVERLLDIGPQDFCEYQFVYISFVHGEPLAVSLISGPPAGGDQPEMDCSMRCKFQHICDATLQFYTLAGTRTFSQFIGPARTTLTSRAANECFILAKEWLKDCIVNHATCAPPSDHLPTRVIKVGSDEEEPSLYVSSTERARWVALSHCWGGSQILNTTTSTVTERRQGIKMSSLPKTFQDAVIITRNLGIEYLWIDSLCILQDSAEDWAQESAKMASVYSGATLVIAADAASNSTEGCFGPFPRGPGPMISHALPCHNDDGLDCQVHVRSVPENVRHGVDHIVYRGNKLRNLISPLVRRAWALQERLLAPRILHFGYSELAWECGTHTICECTPFPEAQAADWHTQFRSRPLGQPEQSPKNLEHPPSRTEFDAWYALVEQYTSQALTFKSDRLAALSGLAAKRQSVSGEYICGLWRDDLVRGLLWNSYHPPEEKMYWTDERHARHEQYIAPSWSWASIHGCVEYHIVKPWRLDTEVVEVLDVEYTLVSSNVYGAAASASVTLRGCLLPIVLETDWSIYLNMRAYANETNDDKLRVPLNGRLSIDVDDGDMSRQEVLEKKSLFLLILTTSSNWFAPAGIVLQEIENTPGQLPTFERVGAWDAIGTLDPHGAVAEIAMETMEPQVFRIV